MILRSRLLNIPGLEHGFTTRGLGSDYKRLGSILYWPTSQIMSLKQVHSHQIYLFPSLSLPKIGSGLVSGDALMTQKEKVLLVMRVADCIPVLIYVPEKPAIANIHAGWRGVVSQIIPRTISSLVNLTGVHPGAMKAVIGAGLCKSCFEIGPEILEQFKDLPQSLITQGKGDRFLVDLVGACYFQLQSQGLKEIERMSYCTQCDRNLFYSYRGGDKKERQISFIGLKCFPQPLKEES